MSSGERHTAFNSLRGFIVEDSLTSDPKKFMDLISILDTYLEEEENESGQFFVIKDGVKILL